MIDITIQNFESELIQASLTTPVLLDIWAPWCGPCKSLGPILERLETQYAGRFILAKLNSDEQPEIAGQLSQAFGVRSIPFCVMFSQGAPVDGFVGALPESEIRAFLDKHLPSADELEAEADVQEAEALQAAGADREAVYGKLVDALMADASNHTARYDLLKLLLQWAPQDPRRLAEARSVFDEAKAEAQFDSRLSAAGLWLTAAEANARERRSDAELAAAIAANKRDFDARLALADRRMAAADWTAAMDELLEIIMRDKAWADETARKRYVAILELMSKPAPKAAAAIPGSGTLQITGKAAVTPADPVLDQYRRKLSMALF